MITPTAPLEDHRRGDDEDNELHQRVTVLTVGRRRPWARAGGRRSRARRSSRPRRRTRRRRPATVARIHPLVCGVVALAPVLPRQALGLAVVVDDQLVLGVDRVAPVGEAELEQLALGDGLGRAGLDAHVAVDAAQVVDLVDEAEALARRRRVGRVVVGAAHVDALGRADAGTQLAADALLHAVLVAVEDVAAVQALGLGDLLVAGDVLRAPRWTIVLPFFGDATAGVRRGDAVAAEQAVLAQGDEEAVEVPHQNIAPSRSRLRALTAVGRRQQHGRRRPARRRRSAARPSGSSRRPGRCGTRPAA